MARPSMRDSRSSFSALNRSPRIRDSIASRSRRVCAFARLSTIACVGFDATKRMAAIGNPRAPGAGSAAERPGTHCTTSQSADGDRYGSSDVIIHRTCRPALAQTRTVSFLAPSISRSAPGHSPLIAIASSAPTHRPGMEHRTKTTPASRPLAIAHLRIRSAVEGTVADCRMAPALQGVVQAREGAAARFAGRNGAAAVRAWCVCSRPAGRCSVVNASR
jgi:hypothetical protein